EGGYMSDPMSRRDAIKHALGAAAGTVAVLGSANAEETAASGLADKWPMAKHSWTRIQEDGRDVLVIPDPGADKVKLLVEGMYAVIRSQKDDPKHFHMDWIDHQHDQVIELPFNTVINYEGVNPRNPLQVIFQNNNEKH